MFPLVTELSLLFQLFEPGWTSAQVSEWAAGLPSLEKLRPAIESISFFFLFLFFPLFFFFFCFLIVIAIFFFFFFLPTPLLFVYLIFSATFLYHFCRTWYQDSQLTGRQLLQLEDDDLVEMDINDSTTRKDILSEIKKLKLSRKVRKKKRKRRKRKKRWKHRDTDREQETK